MIPAVLSAYSRVVSSAYNNTFYNYIYIDDKKKGTQDESKGNTTQYMGLRYITVGGMTDTLVPIIVPTYKDGDYI